MKVKYCHLESKYDSKFKSKITILKICDRFMESYKNVTLIEKSVCPFCNNELINYGEK